MFANHQFLVCSCAFIFSVDKSGLSLLSLLKIDQSCILEIFRRLENIVLSEETESEKDK